MTGGLTLAFDTAGPHCAACLRGAKGTLVARYEEMKTGQAERLMPLLEELLAQAGATWADLVRIGVGTGPGNFTGVRIAVSAARALSLALKVPAVGVSAFARLAHSYGGPEPVLLCVPALRGQVYVQRFAGGGPQGAPRITQPGTFDAALAEPGLSFAGYDAGPLAAPYDARGDAGPADEDRPETIAARIAQIAEGTAGDEVTARPRPVYVRPADAAPPADAPPRIIP